MIVLNAHRSFCHERATPRQVASVFPPPRRAQVGGQSSYRQTPKRAAKFVKRRRVRPPTLREIQRLPTRSVRPERATTMPVRDGERQYCAINLTQRANVLSHHFVNSVHVPDALNESVVRALRIDVHWSLSSQGRRGRNSRAARETQEIDEFSSCSNVHRSASCLPTLRWGSNGPALSSHDQG